MKFSIDKNSVFVASVNIESHGTEETEWYLCISLTDRMGRIQGDQIEYWLARTKVEKDIFDHEDTLKKLVENLIMEKMTTLMETPVIFLALPNEWSSFRFLVWRRI